MLTQPDDLAEVTVRDALATAWNFEAVSLSYQAVGFGSHHWLAADSRGSRLFVTADDLSAKKRAPDDTTDVAFGRLRQAFMTALSLHRDVGLVFVLAPIPADDGRVLHRLQDRYSLVIHPYLADCQFGPDGRYGSSADRLAVVDLLIALHRADAAKPATDDFVIPDRTELRTAIGETTEPWQSGPYAARARNLLAVHAKDVEALLSAYDDLAVRVSGRPDRMVITHGEPHAANVLKTPDGFVFVDWEAVLLAPPERDLWNLAEQEPGVLDAHSAATGTDVDQDALSLYRMWYDLAEISCYVRFFREPHADTADAAESWRNMQHFLRPAQRWPDVFTDRVVSNVRYWRR